MVNTWAFFTQIKTFTVNNKYQLNKFGEDVEGYNVPVLNEREIRAAAGILFVLMFISLMFVLFKEDFRMIKYVILVFFTDLVLRVFVSPRLSPSLILGRLIVSGQTPEYVGSAPKKFAWKIGIGLSGLMFLLLVVINSTSVITVSTCFICLSFLFFEAAFGICLGCVFYPLFYKEYAKICSGEICKQKGKENIQKISPLQIGVIACFIVFVTLAIFFFHDHFNQKPRNLWELLGTL
jgi:hypothetical protein